ncbi:hypothetical protein APV28_3172 [Comamonas testosteroni]|nr:hypothetical protein APV28_3172 [Comamonas testosteroni]
MHRPGSLRRAASADDTSSDYRQFPALSYGTHIETNKTLSNFTPLPCAIGQRSKL